MAARGLPEAVGPHQLAGLGVERDHRAARAGGRVEHALDHERRAFELELGTGAEVVGLEAPGHLELAEVAAVICVERRILAAAQVGGVHRPIAVLGAGLTGCRRLTRLTGHARRHPRDADDEQRQRRHRPEDCSRHHFTPETETPDADSETRVQADDAVSSMFASATLHPRAGAGGLSWLGHGAAVQTMATVEGDRSDG